MQVNTVTSALAYMSVGYDNSWSFERWAAQFQIKITRREKDLLEFEMMNVDPSITNALRRILICEVPTVAIEHVFVIDNTSEMADEVLSHRLGLVPLTVDAEDLEERRDVATQRNTVVFKLHVQCKRVRHGELCMSKQQCRASRSSSRPHEYKHSMSKAEQTGCHLSLLECANASVCVSLFFHVIPVS
jgi:hypothetical protein